MTNLKPKPKILFVTLSMARGGTEGHLREIAPRLAARGWPVTIYCLIESGPLAEGLSALGVSVVTRSARGGKASRLPNALRAAMSAPHLLATLRRLRPGIVHFFLPAAYLIGAPLALLARVPVRIMSRRSQNDYQSAHPIAGRLERKLHGRMSAILGNSRRVVRELIDEENCREADVGLLYNGVTTERFGDQHVRSEKRRELGLDDGDYVIVTVANLIPYKGHEDLLRGLAIARAELPPAWVLLCVGRDDGIGDKLQALATELGLAAHVRFLGSHAGVPGLLSAADMGVLASHEEGFSNAVLEGMAAGLPMVVTDVGGNAEAVTDGVHGYVVPPRNPHELARALGLIASDTVRAQAMGAAGRRRIEERFSMDACVAAYEIVYNGLLAGAHAGTLAPVAERPELETPG